MGTTYLNAPALRLCMLKRQFDFLFGMSGSGHFASILSMHKDEPKR
ncbi:hypothetical protein NOC27_2360 [Nitrosococcus oceani AFC27]|nr:hypothetical protein NOC27_2360 [Nitrosococcus oceani AFC27]